MTDLQQKEAQKREKEKREIKFQERRDNVLKTKPFTTWMEKTKLCFDQAAIIRITHGTEMEPKARKLYEEKTA